MTKILKAYVDWLEEFDNPPGLVVEVDKLPEADDFVYREVIEGANRWYLGCERSGEFFSFFFLPNYDIHPQDKGRLGYGGASFTLNMLEGKAKTIVGPWSSRPSCVSYMFGLKDPIMSVTLKRGYSLISSAMRVSAVRKILKPIGLGVVEIPSVEECDKQVWREYCGEGKEGFSMILGTQESHFPTFCIGGKWRYYQKNPPFVVRGRLAYRYGIYSLKAFEQKSSPRPVVFNPLSSSPRVEYPHSN